jgi:rhamnopyranosyl-N-acetylglucosaminyl-diphospho-decaprenol beta-1,3/1,4-galactofuranosyltransferase
VASVPEAGGRPGMRGAGGQGAERPDPPRVIAVVVTYNRRELLLEALAAVQAQSHAPDAVIVVDNASPDGTAAAVRARFPAVRLAELARNTGGAGGFAYGVALAMADAADLIWLMDDDTVPEPGALRALLRAREHDPARPPALIASRVVWTDGRPHPLNTPRAKPLAGRDESRAAAAAGCLPIRSASFVSVLVDAAETRRRGLPQADYFLWNDDFEFTTRLLRGNRGWLCPASVVVHKTRAFGSISADPGPRFFYEVRNKIWMLRSGASLSPLESALYGGSTLRRWARMFAGSHDRRTLWSSLVRGVAAGVRTRPRRTEEVLAELGPAAPAGEEGPAPQHAGRHEGDHGG